MSTENQTPPPELVEQCNEINRQWLASIRSHVEPYLAHLETNSEWRLRVRSIALNTLLIAHLVPSKVDGHTLYLTVEAIDHAFVRGVNVGRHTATRQVMEGIANMVGIETKSLLL